MQTPRKVRSTEMTLTQLIRSCSRQALKTSVHRHEEEEMTEDAETVVISNPILKLR